MAPRRREPYRILLPLANPRTARDLVRIGSGVADGRPTEITALGIVEVPEGVSLSEGAHQARIARRLLQRVLDFGDEEGVELRTMVRIGRRASDGVIEAVSEEGTDLVIFGWAGPRTPAQAARAEAEATEARLAGAEPRPPSVFTTTIDAVVRESPCDIAVVKQRGLDNVGSILVPVRGGPHAELAIRLARDLGKRFGAQVVVMHIVPKGIGERALAREQEALDAFVREHGGGRRVVGILREGTSVRTTIIREAAHHDLVVMGAGAQPSQGRHGSDGRYLFGSVPEAVVSKARADGHRGEDEADARHLDLRRAAGGGGHARPRRRVRGAQPRAAVGRRQVVRREHVPRRRVQRRRASSWRSRRRPGPDDQRRAAGAQRGEDDRPRHPPHQGRPRWTGCRSSTSSSSSTPTAPIAPPRSRPSSACRWCGTRRSCPRSARSTGKGEALWKSLHVLDGDIVAWIDTDISNIQPRFVYRPPRPAAA